MAEIIHDANIRGTLLDSAVCLGLVSGSGPLEEGGLVMSVCGVILLTNTYINDAEDCFCNESLKNT